MKNKEEQFRFIDKHKDTHPIASLASMMAVSRAGYYKWRKREGKRMQDKKDEALLPCLVNVFREHHGTYGRERMKIAIRRAYGEVINLKRISRLMRKHHLHCQIRQKRFQTRLQPHPAIPNILDRNFTAYEPGRKYAIDITYVEVKKGANKWLYVCAIKDLFNQEIVAWSIGDKQTVELVMEALDQLEKRRFANGAILHSDQGIQFTNRGYMKRLDEMGLTQSMSRRGNCWDNACIENFFSHMKGEMACFGSPETAGEVRQAVNQFMDYYNHKRIITKLQMSPVEYRKEVG